jgi:hypothetical protein
MGFFSKIFGKNKQIKSKSNIDPLHDSLRSLLRDLPVTKDKNVSDYQQKLIHFSGSKHPLMFEGSIDETIDFVVRMMEKTTSYILPIKGIIKLKRRFLISSLPVDSVLEIQYDQYWNDGSSAIYSEHVLRVEENKYNVFGSEKSAARMKG